jgi:sugar phosphate isomerase/epimerase
MTLMIAQTTIYRQSTGDPEPSIRAIAEAGFTHLHWSHQWYTDFLYSAAELAQIQRWLKMYHLQVLDIHASAGQEKRWDAPEEYRRLAGVELVRNRLEMAAQLGAGAIVLHAYPNIPVETQRRSLAELEPYARLLGVRIALENLFEGNQANLTSLFDEFPPDFLGFCYDTGHGNMLPDGLDFLETWKERLVALHIHDNDGVNDLHKLPFNGTVDWQKFIHILDRSAYRGPVNLECTLGNHKDMADFAFLQAAFQAGARLQAMRSDP